MENDTEALFHRCYVYVILISVTYLSTQRLKLIPKFCLVLDFCY